MAYDSRIQYRGDLYMHQAIANLGEKAGEAIANYRRDRAESRFLEQEAQGLAQSAQQFSSLLGEASPELLKIVEQNVTKLGKSGGMSLAQKRALVAGVRFDRNDEIERILRKLGYDVQGRLITVAQGPNATAVSVQPSPDLAQPVFSNLPVGAQTNWGGAAIRYKGRNE